MQNGENDANDLPSIKYDTTVHELTERLMRNNTDENAWPSN